MAIPFRERNPVPIGLVGLLVLGALLLLAFNVQKLPIIGRGTHYTADFSEVGGLKQGDAVMVAGVEVGKVDDMALHAGHVVIHFTVTDRDARFGTDTTASVRMKTLLGQKYLSLEPAGAGKLSTKRPIPLSRTVSSYDVVDAFSDLATTEERVDVPQLSKSLDTLATEFKDSPPSVRGALAGLTALSRSISSRDDELQALLARTRAVSGTVAARNQQVDALVKDGNLLLAELDRRRAAIHTLLTNTAALAAQLTKLVDENRAQLKPALDQLHGVLATLRKHQDDLDAGIKAMAPFTRVFANTLGTGRWFDTYIPNLVPVGGTIPIK